MVTQSPSKKGGYKRITEIGKDGKGTKGIHATDHGQSNAHSDPHTHAIILDPYTSSPRFDPPVNKILESKNYKCVIYMKKVYLTRNILKK